jgi:protein dithiol oxidoreductase (disulfide-forming)
MRNPVIRACALALLLCLGACTRESSSKEPAATQSGSIAGLEKAADKGWQPGTHYVLIDKPERVENADGRIEVAEIFWYGCTHCYVFEPHLVLWEKHQAKNVHVVRVPALLFEPQRIHARLFYTLQALGRDDVHQSVYDAIHRDGNTLTAATAEQALASLLPFAKSHGIEAAAFERAYNSDIVAKQTARAERLMRAYKVESTPSIVVDGRYRTDVFLAGSQERLIALTQHLVEALPR